MEWNERLRATGVTPHTSHLTPFSLRSLCLRYNLR